MSQIIIDLDDQFASQIYAYTPANQTTFESMTKKLWQDFLNYKTQKSDQNDDFLQSLNATKGIWQPSNDLSEQN